MSTASPSFKATNRCTPISSRLFPATSTLSSGSTRLFRTSANRKRLTAIPTRSFRGLAARVCIFVTFPPASVFADPSFDGEAARDEALIRLTGLADHFEKEDPAMHKTNTVDYAIVYDGEVWMELDNNETVHLKRGDVVVQNGTRHAWRNRGTRPVTMLFFLNGAKA
jgi:mannose-6-phosphate isomerase-like protein (cupin superfamily)